VYFIFSREFPFFRLNETQNGRLAVSQNPTRSSQRFHGPVRWLLGAQLLAGLKYIALYTGFKSELDHRDWMQAQCCSFEDAAKTEFWFDYAADTGDDEKAAYSLAYLWMKRHRYLRQKNAAK